MLNVTGAAVKAKTGPSSEGEKIVSQEAPVGVALNLEVLLLVSRFSEDPGNVNS